MSDLSWCYGVLAMESAAPLVKRFADREVATEMADYVATDLSWLLTGVEDLDLAVATAAFDPSELLRPGWPVHSALVDLVQRAPDMGGPRVLGFGSHDGEMPPQLRPNANLRDGLLRLVPFVLHGDPAVLAPVAEQIEETLLEKGMAQAATMAFAQRIFNVPLQHVRYLSLHDLVTMTALQYENAGIDPLWPLIDNALFHPEREAWLDAPPEPLLYWDGEKVRMAEMDLDAWQAHGFLPPGFEGDKAARGHMFFERRQQQYRAVLGTHAITVEMCPVTAAQDPRAVLAQA